MKTTWFGMQVQSRKNRIINKIVMHKLLKCLLLDRKVENALKAKTGGFSSSSIFFTHQIDILISYASRVNVHKNCVFFLHLLLNFFCNRKSLQMFLPPKLRSRIFLPKSKYGLMLKMHCFSSSMRLKFNILLGGFKLYASKKIHICKKTPNILNFKHKWQQVLSAYKCKEFNLYLHFKGWGPWQ